MAKKGQRYNKYNIELKNKIIKEKDQGISYHELERK